MACEYHLSSRSSFLVKNVYGPNGGTVAPATTAAMLSTTTTTSRMGSYRKPKEQPIIKIKCSTNCHNNNNNIDNNNLSNKYVTNSSSAVMKKLAGYQQETRIKPITAPSPTMLGQNKSYYSSTRSFSSKCAANGVFIGSQNAVTSISSFIRNSKTTSSSGNSSVESIAPKYQGLNGNGLIDGGAKKRAYQTVKVAKKQVPVNVDHSISNMRTFNYHNNASIALHHHHHQTRNTNKKQMTAYTNNHLLSSFSKKFPNGLPFEDEFYRSRKRNSVKSENSDFSTAYESDQCPLPFEEEFSRRKSSTEPLYVDFSKRLPDKDDHDDDDDDDDEVSPNTNHFFDKFDRASNYVCQPNEVIVHDQPVVHVAVTWWAPECQQFGSDLVSHPTSTYLDDV